MDYALKERENQEFFKKQIKEDEEQPQEQAEKCDVTADAAEQLSCPQAKSLESPEQAADLKDIVDVNLTDQQTSSSSCAQ